MATPPHPPPPVPPVFLTDGGGNSVSHIGNTDFISIDMLAQLAGCGFNQTFLEDFGVNMTYVSSLNISHQVGYWSLILLELNCSRGPFPTEPPFTDESSSSKQTGLLIAYFATIMALGLSMNICVIATILQARRLRTVTNTFVLSLALADLLMAAVVIPLQIHDVLQPRVLSHLLDPLFPILGVASLLNLCAVTLDRFFTITRPLTYEAKVSPRRVGIIIACIWLISIAQEAVRFSIREDHPEQIFQVVRFALVFSVPFTCVLFVNVKIYVIARAHSRQIAANDPNLDGRSTRSFAKKLKTARIIGLLVGTFVLTWLPFFVMTVCEIFIKLSLPKQEVLVHARKLKIGNTVCAALASSTAFFNPLLYGLMRKEVREAMLRCIKCQNINQIDGEGSTGRNEATTHFHK
ncbi:predicted protein [Nematostella vectensis]|uniref:G-protein coupled receptors family 1 profile domain-containing protein n=1 Tax=Nematostella vectensis TaxID=45351 RepID=A7RZD0_NEMVE|nr:5-hydroxytryptamine receptor 1A [Nematostella vectensis]EDO43219.1 predicted protein [Nematostella vectensis]|eukprot:XP_001635282.1 predicted protein [Nematostella vectensis]